LTDGTSAKRNDALFVRRVLIAIGLVGMSLLLWEIRHLLILAFGAILVAVILRSIAGPLQRYLRVPQAAALTLSILLVAGLFGAVIWLLGSEIARQVSEIADTLPDAWRSLVRSIGGPELVAEVERVASDSLPETGAALTSVGAALMSVGASLVDIAVAIAAGIYIASQPVPYRRGFLKLFPKKRRPLAEEALGDAGRALRLWLLGQLIAMVAVGVLTGVGFWLIGLPSALSLGLIAGVLEFIPYVGPVLAAVPAILFAFAQRPELALWALGLFILIQQIEGNVITPLVQQYAVEIPAALLLFVLLGGGMLFGAIWLALAAPLTVVGYVLVKRLYVQEALHTPTQIPGRDDG
jgi:predicted PurR-regulated permease PerM